MKVMILGNDRYAFCPIIKGAICWNLNKAGVTLQNYLANFLTRVSDHNCPRRSESLMYASPSAYNMIKKQHHYNRVGKFRGVKFFGPKN